MPQKDKSHDMVKKALIKNGWEITDDPYVISYGERFLFVDLGADESKFATNSHKNIKGRFGILHLPVYTLTQNLH